MKLFCERVLVSASNRGGTGRIMYQNSVKKSQRSSGMWVGSSKSSKVAPSLFWYPGAQPAFSKPQLNSRCDLHYKRIVDTLYGPSIWVRTLRKFKVRSPVQNNSWHFVWALNMGPDVTYSTFRFPPLLVSWLHGSPSIRRDRPDYVPKFGEKKVREAAGCGWVHQNLRKSRPVFFVTLQFVTHDARLLQVR